MVCFFSYRVLSIFLGCHITSINIIFIGWIISHLFVKHSLTWPLQCLLNPHLVSIMPLLSKFYSLFGHLASLVPVPPPHTLTPTKHTCTHANTHAHAHTHARISSALQPCQSKAGSKTSGMGTPWELVRNPESLTPPGTYSIRIYICIWTRSPGDS